MGTSELSSSSSVQSHLGSSLGNAAGLLTIIRKNKAKSKEMRVLFLGLDNAGKTTILKRLIGEDISSISPTLGFNIKTFLRSGYTLNIWDVGGQRTLRPYWRNYFEATDAVVWVVDSSDRLRVSDCKAELRTLLQEERLAGATLLVFANKQDITGAMTLEEIRDGLDLPSIVSHEWSIRACSAVTAAGLEEGMDWMIREVAGRLYWNDSISVKTNPKPASAPATPVSTTANEMKEGIPTA